MWVSWRRGHTASSTSNSVPYWRRRWPVRWPPPANWPSCSATPASRSTFWSPGPMRVWMSICAGSARQARSRSRRWSRRPSGSAWPASPITARFWSRPAPRCCAWAAPNWLLPPGAFLQATRRGEAVLAGCVSDGVGEARKIADLFCGVGTFALRLAERAKVQAWDNDGKAVAALAKAGQGTPGLRQITAEQRDLFQRPLRAEELAGFDALVFDPPRAGAAAQAAQIARSDVPVVMAVSCDTGSFARDAAALVAGRLHARSDDPRGPVPLFGPCRDRGAVSQGDCEGEAPAPAVLSLTRRGRPASGRRSARRRNGAPIRPGRRGGRGTQRRRIRPRRDFLGSCGTPRPHNPRLKRPKPGRCAGTVWRRRPVQGLDPAAPGSGSASRSANAKAPR